MKKIYSVAVYILVFLLTSAGNSISYARTIYPVGPDDMEICPEGEDLFWADTSDDATSSLQPGISIFPNPVKSSATISFTFRDVDKITILNIVGKEMKTYTPEPGIKDLKVNLLDLQPGVYFLCAYYKGQTLVTKKFMKDK